jgi:hypothetical protein
MSVATTNATEVRDRPLQAPWAPVEPVPDPLWPVIERLALRSNDRYLEEVVEAWSFCPFAREGRLAGATAREVFRCGAGPGAGGRQGPRGSTVGQGLAQDADSLGLLELFRSVAGRTQHAVSQVILPLVQVGPEAFGDFCQQLTAIGNASLPEPVLACAPLHPDLPYGTANPYQLVPLFRRAPDPTIQWVRLDGLDAIYAGRTSGTVCPTPEELERILRDGPKAAPKLYDRVAETNAKMARRIGIPKLEALLRTLSDEAQRSYGRAILGDGAREAGACPTTAG